MEIDPDHEYTIIRLTALEGEVDTADKNLQKGVARG